MKLRLLIISFALCLLNQVAHAANDDSALLTQQLANITTFSAQFSQVIEDAKGRTLQQVQGQLVAAKPNRFYWHSQAPYQQTIVSDAKTVWIVDDDLEQVTIQKLDPHVGRTPALLLSGRLEQLTSTFKISMTERKAQASVLREYKLVPKDSNSLFDAMILRFRNQDLAAMDLTDQTGQHTSIRFEDVKLNQPIADSRFQAVLPPGYDVMDQRKETAKPL
jgi:outer membrane lipoprotein carrier protein